MKRVLVLCVLLTSLAACLDWESGIPCRTDNHCPEEMACRAEVCETGARGTSSDGGTLSPDGGI